MIGKAPEGERQPPHSWRQLRRLGWGRRVGRDQGQGQRTGRGAGVGWGGDAACHPSQASHVSQAPSPPFLISASGFHHRCGPWTGTRPSRHLPCRAAKAQRLPQALSFLGEGAAPQTSVCLVDCPRVQGPMAARRLDGGVSRAGLRRRYGQRVGLRSRERPPGCEGAGLRGSRSLGRAGSAQHRAGPVPENFPCCQLTAQPDMRSLLSLERSQWPRGPEEGGGAAAFWRHEAARA